MSIGQWPLVIVAMIFEIYLSIACLFGDSGRFSNLDFSASELSAELNLAIGNILVSSSISPPNLEPRPGLPQKKAGGRRLV